MVGDPTKVYINQMQAVFAMIVELGSLGLLKGHAKSHRRDRR